MEMIALLAIVLTMVTLNSRTKVADNSSQLMYLYMRNKLSNKYGPLGDVVDDKL